MGTIVDCTRLQKDPVRKRFVAPFGTPHSLTYSLLLSPIIIYVCAYVKSYMCNAFHLQCNTKMRAQWRSFAAKQRGFGRIHIHTEKRAVWHAFNIAKNIESRIIPISLVLMQLEAFQCSMPISRIRLLSSLSSAFIRHMCSTANATGNRPGCITSSLMQGPFVVPAQPRLPRR
jgi:hypothetical protein